MAALFTSLRALRTAPSAIRVPWMTSARTFVHSRPTLRSSSPILDSIKSRVAATGGPATRTTTATMDSASPLRARNAGVLASVAALGLGLSVFYRETPVSCDTPAVVSTPPRARDPLPPPPASTVNVYELSFGTVCGICAGVFLKKGAKALAFVFGGVFVLLQYFTSLSITHVDWSRMASRFEKLFYSPAAEPGGAPRPPSVTSLWNWLVNFLTADFQQRASFLAGFALGLRIG